MLAGLLASSVANWLGHAGGRASEVGRDGMGGTDGM